MRGHGRSDTLDAVTDRLEPTVAFELVAPAFRAARHLGHAPGALWSAAGLPEDASLSSGDRVAVEDAHALWRGGVALARDTGFGLLAASLSEQGDLDVLDYVLRGSPTLRAAFEKVSRFWRLAHDAASLDLVPNKGKLVCEANVEDGLDVPPAFTEWGIAAWARTTREVFGPMQYHEVHFRHAPQAEPARYHALFGCAPRFLAPKDALVMGMEVLDHVNHNADPRLVDMLERYAESRMSEIPERPTLAARVKALLKEALPSGDTGPAGIARRLKMSERTLRRRLEAERTSHRELLDAIRRELALRYVGEEGRSVEEACFKLGFDSPSSLHRAFKRWTGVSPAHYRARLAPPA